MHVPIKNLMGGRRLGTKGLNDDLQLSAILYFLQLESLGKKYKMALIGR